MYPFNTIPRPALIYNPHDERFMAGSQGVFPAEIWGNVLRQPPVRDPAAFRNFSTVNLYSYFACDEERTVHFARLATACIGTGKSADQIYFNLHSVLHLLQDTTRAITPDSRARILGGLIDEVVRFGLPKGQAPYISRSHSAFDAMIDATLLLPGPQQVEIRWRIITGVAANRMAISDRNRAMDGRAAQIKYNDPLPLQDRGLVEVAYEASCLWTDKENGKCNHTLDQTTDLIHRILSLPQGRKVALLTSVAKQIGKMQSNFGCREASDAVIAGCTDWPFHERVGVLAAVLGNRSYWENFDGWQNAIGSLLAEFKSIPLDKKPAAIVHLIQLLDSFLENAHTFEPRQYDFPWKLASRLVEQAARLKSVHSTANVMQELSGLVMFMSETSVTKVATILTKAFSSDNEREARTRARQLLCLRLWNTLLSRIADDVRMHPKVRLTASLMLRIKELPYPDARPREERTFDPKELDEPCAIWTEAKALGSKRCDDIRTMLLKKMWDLPFPNMPVAFEKMLQDERKLSPQLKENLLRAFIAYSRQEDVENRPPQRVIDAFISLVFTRPSSSLLVTLVQLMDAISIKWMRDPATSESIAAVIAKCLQLPPASIRSTLIELTDSMLFAALDCAPLAETLFHQMLEKTEQFPHEQKGPLLAALAKLISCLAPAVRETAFAALLRQADTLPQDTRNAWHLCLRIVAINRLTYEGAWPAYFAERQALATAIHDQEKEPNHKWLWPMLVDRITFEWRPENRDYPMKQPAW